MSWFFGSVIVSYLLTSTMAHKNILLYALFTLPGTILHELCHYIVALFTLSRPSFPSIIPQRIDGNLALGSVSFVPGFFTAWLVALAPLYLMPVAAYWIYLTAKSLSTHDKALYLVLLGWVESAAIFACLPSRQDIKIAISYPFGMIIFGAAIWWWFDIDHHTLFNSVQTSIYTYWLKIRSMI